VTGYALDDCGSDLCRDKGVLASPEYLDQLVGHPAFCAMGIRFFS